MFGRIAEFLDDYLWNVKEDYSLQGPAGLLISVVLLTILAVATKGVAIAAGLKIGLTVFSLIPAAVLTVAPLVAYPLCLLCEGLGAIEEGIKDTTKKLFSKREKLVVAEENHTVERASEDLLKAKKQSEKGIGVVDVKSMRSKKTIKEEFKKEL